MEESKESEKSILNRLHVFFAPILFFLLVQYIISTPSVEGSQLNPTLFLILLFFAAFVLESKYVPYVGILPTPPIIYMILEYDWLTIPALLRIYAQSALVVCTASFILFYKKDAKGPLYSIPYILYSLKTVFPIYLSYFIFGSFSHPYFMYSFIVFAILSWAVYLEIGM